MGPAPAFVGPIGGPYLQRRILPIRPVRWIEPTAAGAVVVGEPGHESLASEYRHAIRLALLPSRRESVGEHQFSTRILCGFEEQPPDFLRAQIELLQGAAHEPAKQIAHAGRRQTLRAGRSDRLCGDECLPRAIGHARLQRRLAQSEFGTPASLQPRCKTSFIPAVQATRKTRAKVTALPPEVQAEANRRLTIDHVPGCHGRPPDGALRHVDRARHGGRVEQIKYWHRLGRQAERAQRAPFLLQANETRQFRRAGSGGRAIPHEPDALLHAPRRGEPPSALGDSPSVAPDQAVMHGSSESRRTHVEGPRRASFWPSTPRRSGGRRRAACEASRRASMHRA